MEDRGLRIEDRSYFDLQYSIFNPRSSIFTLHTLEAR